MLEHEQRSRKRRRRDQSSVSPTSSPGPKRIALQSESTANQSQSAEEERNGDADQGCISFPCGIREVTNAVEALRAGRATENRIELDGPSKLQSGSIDQLSTDDKPHRVSGRKILKAGAQIVKNMNMLSEWSEEVLQVMEGNRPFLSLSEGLEQIRTYSEAMEEHLKHRLMPLQDQLMRYLECFPEALRSTTSESESIEDTPMTQENDQLASDRDNSERMDVHPSSCIQHETHPQSFQEIEDHLDTTLDIITENQNSDLMQDEHSDGTNDAESDSNENSRSALQQQTEAPMTDSNSNRKDEDDNAPSAKDLADLLRSVRDLKTALQGLEGYVKQLKSNVQMLSAQARILGEGNWFRRTLAEGWLNALRPQEEEYSDDDNEDEDSDYSYSCFWANHDGDGSISAVSPALSKSSS